MNGSTWVQCTISDGHISQVFFLSQRSINSNDQAVRMPGKNLFACVTKVECMYRLYKCSVNIYSWKTKGTEPMTNIRTKTVSCDTIGSNTEKDKICPMMGIGKNAFF